MELAVAVGNLLDPNLGDLGTVGLTTLPPAAARSNLV
jgi:hypothetical protein